MPRWFEAMALFAFCAIPFARAGPPDPRLGVPFAPRERPCLGSERAPVVVVEVASYRCLRCLRFHERVFPRLRAAYVATGRVQWFLVPASVDSGDEAAHVFLVGRCLERQGSLWAAFDLLLRDGGLGDAAIDAAVAAEPAVDRRTLADCERDCGARQEVRDDFAECRLLRVESTPTFLIRRLDSGGRGTEAEVVGDRDFGYFQRIFDRLLAAR